MAVRGDGRPSYYVRYKIIILFLSGKFYFCTFFLPFLLLDVLFPFRLLFILLTLILVLRLTVTFIKTLMD